MVAPKLERRLTVLDVHGSMSSRLSQLLLLCSVLVASAKPCDVELSNDEVLGSYHQGVIAVKQRNVDKLENELLAVSDPYSPRFGKHWTREQLVALTANPEGTEATKAFLVQAGLIVTGESLAGEYLTVNGTVSSWNTLLNTTLSALCPTTTKGSLVFRSNSSVTIPPSLANHVEAVLNMAFRPALLNRPARPAPLKSPTVLINGVVTPALLWQVYGIVDGGVNPAGFGITQAIYSTLGQSFSSSDIVLFRKRFGLLPLQTGELIDPLHRDNKSACSLDSRNCDENSLDLQYISAVSQGAKVLEWFDPEDSDMFTSWITTAASTPQQDLPNVISISYGIHEADIIGDSYGEVLAKLFDIEAAKLGLMGSTIVAASGDAGCISLSWTSKDFSNGRVTCIEDVIWPASSPYVLSVGATMGPESGAHTKTEEIVCSVAASTASDPVLITSGGGISLLYPKRPSWQADAVGSYLSGMGTPGTAYVGRTWTGRGVPDVAALGHNYVVVLNGTAYTFDGTSASAPVWAGVVSLINGGRIKQGLPTLGFLNPALYTAVGPSAFNDVVKGDNRACNWVDSQGTTNFLSCRNIGFAATAGWDATTGLGTPRFQALAASLSALSAVPSADASPSGLSTAAKIGLGVGLGGGAVVVALGVAVYNAVAAKGVVGAAGAQNIARVYVEPTVAP